MLKRSLILLACGAKALLFTAGLVTLPAVATADEDCPSCQMPPPPCEDTDTCES